MGVGALVRKVWGPGVFHAALLLLLMGVDRSGAEAEAAEPTEVVVIATQHFITDMPDGYTPAHLRVLLHRVSPDILGVEAPTNVRDPWASAPLDLRSVTRPWADANDVEAIPVAWYEPRYQVRLAEMLQAFQAGARIKKYQVIEQEFQLRSSRYPPTCEFLNSETGHKLWRDYHAALRRLYGKDTPWEEWNARTVANVVSLCRQHPGKRIAIVFGCAHCYYILDALATVEGIQVLPAERFFPLSREEIDAQTVPRDYLKALRPLNFYNYGGIPFERLQRLEGFLETVKGFPESQNDYYLFHGKLLLHRLRAEEALLEFEKVAGVDPGVTSAFDGRTRLREAGLVFMAIAKNQAGKHAEARKDLQAILRREGLSPATRQWVTKLLQGSTAKPAP